MTNGAGGTGEIQAVLRVGELLSLFTISRPRLTVAEAATRTGLNRTTVHRYFTSLALAGVLERAQDEPTAFTPGRLLLQLGAVAQGQRRVLDLAPRHLRALSVETELTVVLSLWGAAGPVVSFVSEAGTHGILITVRVGALLGHETAQARLFAAFSKDAEAIDQFIATIPADERRKFESDLSGCRKRGLSRVHIPTIDGVVLGAAVFDEHDIAATVALVGTTSSLPPKARALDAALLRCAYRISAELGGLDVWRLAVEDSSVDLLDGLGPEAGPLGS